VYPAWRPARDQRAVDLDLQRAVARCRSLLSRSGNCRPRPSAQIERPPSGPCAGCRLCPGSSTDSRQVDSFRPTLSAIVILSADDAAQAAMFFRRRPRHGSDGRGRVDDFRRGYRRLWWRVRIRLPGVRANRRGGFRAVG
jgi:hypothetical protein